MYYVGIDVGGMSIKFGLVDKDGKIINKSVLHVNYQEDSVEKIVGLMKDQIRGLCSSCKVNLNEVAGIGVGCPGVVDSQKGIVLNAPNIKWFNVHLVELFDDLKIPTFICNDANAAVVGEKVFGVGKEYKNIILLTLGTGVGGGIYIDNKLYEGEGFTGAELGHITIHMDGRECGCGHKGCLEAYASVSGLILDTKEEMMVNRKSLMWEFAMGDLNNVNGRTAFECEKQGDASAKKVVDNYIKHLGEGIRNFLNIFRPECVILGGGLSGQKENLTSKVEAYLDSINWGLKNTPHAKILTSDFGNDAGIIGAAALSMK